MLEEPPGRAIGRREDGIADPEAGDSHRLRDGVRGDDSVLADPVSGSDVFSEWA